MRLSRGSGIPGLHTFGVGMPLLRANHPQRKEGHTSVVVEAMCDHSGRVIAATKSYLGAENGKTMVQRDKSVWRIRDEEPWKSYKYKLYNANGTETEHQGGWLIVDGGYPKAIILRLRVYACCVSACASAVSRVFCFGGITPTHTPSGVCS